MSNNICPHDVFSVAYNGLSMFLTEYPHMDDRQRLQIQELVEKFATPDFYRNKIRRPALKCQAREGAILITPEIVENFS